MAKDLKRLCNVIEKLVDFQYGVAEEQKKEATALPQTGHLNCPYN
jgi:hypothetical protein